jgi:hypothetical protein
MIVEEEQSTKEENKNDINGVPKKQRGFIFSILPLAVNIRIFFQRNTS